MASFQNEWKKTCLRRVDYAVGQPSCRGFLPKRMEEDLVASRRFVVGQPRYRGILPKLMEEDLVRRVDSGPATLFVFKWKS